jgi:hypothetical protein
MKSVKKQFKDLLKKILSGTAFLRFIASVRVRGFVRTLLFIITDRYFDFKNDVNTGSILYLEDLSVKTPNEKHGNPCQSCSAYILKKVLSAIKIDYGGSSLIDYGSGTGRALMVASLYGFKKVTGLEFSEKLCNITNENISKFLNRNNVVTKIDVLNLDVLEYSVPPDANVYLFYNPFDDYMMNQVMIKIKQSYLIYINPVYDRLPTYYDFDVFYEINSRKIKEATIYKYNGKCHQL